MYVLKFVLHRSAHLLAAMIEVISVFSLARKAYPIIFLQKPMDTFRAVFSTSRHMRHRSLFHFETHATSQSFPFQDTCDIAVFSTSIHMRHRSLFHFKTNATSVTLLTVGHLNNTNKICATQRTLLLNS